MPIVGKGTPQEKHFPYDEQGIAAAKEYAAKNNLPIEMEGQSGPKLGGSRPGKPAVSEERKLAAVRSMLGGMGQGSGRY